jgi:hypothetical protein
MLSLMYIDACTHIGRFAHVDVLLHIYLYLLEFLEHSSICLSKFMYLETKICHMYTWNANQLLRAYPSDKHIDLHAYYKTECGSAAAYYSYRIYIDNNHTRSKHYAQPLLLCDHSRTYSWLIERNRSKRYSSDFYLHIKGWQYFEHENQ